MAGAYFFELNFSRLEWLSRRPAFLILKLGFSMAVSLCFYSAVSCLWGNSLGGRDVSTTADWFFLTLSRV